MLVFLVNALRRQLTRSPGQLVDGALRRSRGGQVARNDP